MSIWLRQDDLPAEDDEPDPLALEVEAFLAEHGEQSGEDPSEVFEESEVAEALAVSWKDKRKELGRLQRSRKFGAVSDLRKSYRVEIEELKKTTRCHKCQQVGHWSRECRSSSKGKGCGSARLPVPKDLTLEWRWSSPLWRISSLQWLMTGVMLSAVRLTFCSAVSRRVTASWTQPVLRFCL